MGLPDAEAMFAICCGNRVVDKTRYYVRHGDMVWDVDVYSGNLAGIAFAEIDLRDEDQAFELPDWLGQEVTGDRRFGKQNIVRLCGEHGECPTIEDLRALPAQKLMSRADGTFRIAPEYQNPSSRIRRMMSAADSVWRVMPSVRALSFATSIALRPAGEGPSLATGFPRRRISNDSPCSTRRTSWLRCVLA